jgi:hypothetical protein
VATLIQFTNKWGEWYIVTVPNRGDLCRTFISFRGALAYQRALNG